MMKNYFGTVIKVGNFFYWRFKNAATGKFTQRVLRNESGGKITNLAEAKKVVMILSAERYHIESLASKEEYLFEIAKCKKMLNRSVVQLKDMSNEFLAHPARREISDAHQRTYETAIAHFQKFMTEHYSGITMIADVTPEIAGEYLKFYLGSGICAKTYNSRLQNLNVVFKLLLKNETPFSEFPKKHDISESREAFTLEQLQTIWTVLEDENYYMRHKQEMVVLYFLALYTGARCGDLCLLKKDAINLEKRFINFIPNKTKFSSHKNVVVPIAEPLYMTLLNYISGHESEYFLPQVAARYLKNADGIYKDTTKLLEKAGICTLESKGDVHRQRNIVRYSFHSFRHSFASLAINNSISPAVVKDILGHSSEAMTARYTHIELESKMNAVNALPAMSVLVPPALSLSNSAETLDYEFVSCFQRASGEKLVKVINWLSCKLTNEQKKEIIIILVQ